MSKLTFRAAKTICHMSDWELSNLPLQKLLYLSHMNHLGKTGQPLIDGHFEAWDLGPVEPTLYHKVKAYGSKPIVDIFSEERFRLSQPEHTSISEVYEKFGSASPGMLVAITHRDGGAWSDHYRPNYKGMIIPNRDIRDEYPRWFDGRSNRD